jgi:UDP-N-acetylglucosamine/UDP-N-acetylgalactosamine diphosphorylase
MPTVPTDLRQSLRHHGQEHVLSWWEHLTDDERTELVHQLQTLDFEELRRLYTQQDIYALPSRDQISPVPVVRLGEQDDAARRNGEESLRRGEVAVVLVAGGQGSRLGFERPKGMFPIGPVSGKSLFQIHAEKVLAFRRRYGRPVPLLVMTSHATHEETEAFFREHQWFGLPTDDVVFFRQGEMPALDIATGKLLLESHGRLFTSPNGHGGTLAALVENGLLDRLRGGGTRHIFYFQVDNPLVKVADPVFLGAHIAANADVSCKVVAKLGPTDKMGNFVLVDGRCTMIEYSDLPDELARQTDELGRLRIWAGNPAIHLFSTDFLARVTKGRAGLPLHVARKKVPFVDSQGSLVQPDTENALKFEMFIFDVLPLAKRWVLMETSRSEEFVPLKNATGADSPSVVRQAISNLAADWLEKAGVPVPRQPDGNAAVALEISPLFALDAEELAQKLKAPMKIQEALYLDAGGAS